MTLLIAGIVLFLGIHLVPTATGLRSGLQSRLGEGGYKGLFALVSIAGFVFIVYGFSQRTYVPIWVPPDYMKHITFLLMLPVFILLAAAYIPSRIRTYVRHPMLIGVLLWALAHLLVNGDEAGILLFGSFLVYCVYDIISANARHAAGPLGNRKGGLGGDIAAVAIGLAVYAFMLVAGHYYLIGIPLLRHTALT